MTSENLVNLIRNFYGLQNEYVDFGAADSEPSFIFRNFMRNIEKNNPPKKWDLYDNSMDTKEANEELTKLATKIKDNYLKLNSQEKTKFNLYVENL